MADTKQALTALSQALKLEQEGHAFYLKAAEQTPDPKGRAMFLSLADDERIHTEMVQRQLHALEGDGAYVLLPDLKATPIDASGKLFPPEMAAVAGKVGQAATDLQAIFLALENEIRSYDLYVAAAQVTPDGPGKQMYEWLSAAERTHFNLLMSNFEALSERGSWV